MTIDVSTILKELGGKIDINGDVEMSDRFSWGNVSF